VKAQRRESFKPVPGGSQASVLLISVPIRFVAITLQSDNSQMPKYNNETLRGHGHKIFLRDRFQCRYCGFDGREFLGWMQLSLDHVLPRNVGGGDEESNLVTCCNSCNSVTSRMVFLPGISVADAVAKNGNEFAHVMRDA
jgi:hypothetical protein